MSAAALAEPVVDAPFTLTPYESRRPPAAPPLVVDLSSLWAGPTCARLLGLAGARVVKVESATRPDGARHGPVEFWRRLHDGHESRVVDFRTPEGIAELRDLLAEADVVIEASRPRAMAQLGIVPHELRPTCWVSITAYGRSGPWSDRVGFGDDTAVAGGLVAWDGDTPLFVADAVADPLAGLHAAVAAQACLVGSGTHLIDVSLRDVASYVAGAGR
jgi:crotonobetainyl-CoA:carnitine CoA-transferase CaiB-like acyl-CoA transferase